MELQSAMLDEFLPLCYEQACAQRSSGSPQAAVELLMLALAALSAAASEQEGTARNPTAAASTALVARARLMRQLAICYLQLRDRALATTHAREAVALGPPSSPHHAASLQVLLRILCEGAERQAEDRPPERARAAGGGSSSSSPIPRRDEAAQVALQLMRQPTASVADCLGMCAFLLDCQWSEGPIFMYLAELHARVRDDAGACCEVLRFRLHLAAKCTGGSIACADDSSDTSSTKHLTEVISEIQAFPHSEHEQVLELRRAVASTLWGLADLAMRIGHHTSAAQWLERAIPFLLTPAERAVCWSTVAACVRRAGRKDEANEFAEKAMASDPTQFHAAVIALLSSAERGAPGAEETQRLLRHVLDTSGPLPKQMACIASALLNHPQDDLMFAGLEALARSFLKQSQHGTKGDEHSVVALEFLTVVCALVERSAAKQRPAVELVRFLGLMEQSLSIWRSCVTLELLQGGGTAAAKFCKILSVAWQQGQRLGREKDWASVVSVFETTSKILEHIDSVEVREVFEPRAWCLVMLASAKEQLVKLANGQRAVCSELCERTLHVLDRAHQLCRRAVQLPWSDVPCKLGHGVAFTRRSSTLDRVFRVLVVLEFEVRCLAGDSELQLKCFVDEASSQEAVGSKSLLAMSKVASSVFSRRLAIHCLQRYLRVFVGARGAADYSQCAVAYREIVALHASRNESFAVYEGILHLLSGGGGGSAVAEQLGSAALLPEVISSDCARLYPKEEIAWLVATAWNNGCHFYRLQQYKWCERWMGKSLALERFCSGIFPKEQMIKSYMECLQHCSA